MLTIHGGRTGRLWQALEKQVAASRGENTRCLLIVPEQYTLQAEKDLIAGLSLPGFFDIEVFSYSRFIQRMFMLHNPDGRTRVSGSGKNIAIARALLKRQKDMRYYARAALRKGFVSQMGEWIADMKRAEVSPSQLSEYAASLPEGAYHDKMGDLSLAYTEYARILESKFVDGEDVLAYAIEAVPLSGIVRDADVFVYGFDIVTDDFSRLLCAIAQECRQAHVYLVMDREEAPDGDCFAPVRQSAERLRYRLRQMNIRREWLWCDEEKAARPEDLNYLEMHLLRPSAKGYEGIPHNLSLHAAATPFTEVHDIAHQILQLLDSGVNPDDLCVVCGDIAQYSALFDAVFSSYGIPSYISVKEPLAMSGLARLLLSAVRAVTGGYRQEDMLSLIKSGFVPLDDNAVWALENYVLRYGISGARWHKPFTRGSETEREAPEKARAQLSPVLLSLQSGIREARDGASSLRALMDYLITCDAYHTLLTQEEALMRCGLEAQAIRARQVWTHILGLFEQMHEIAGDSRIPGTVMTTWLEAGLIDESIAALPPSSGCVTVGEIGNLMTHQPGYLFACGLSSSLDESKEKGLLQPDEKQLLSEDMHAYLGMTMAERDRMADLDVWKVLSAAQKRLYISYAQAGQSGTALRCAQVVHTLRRIFPQMPETGGVQAAQGALHPLSLAAAVEDVGYRLRSGALTGEWLSAWKWLMTNQSTRSVALSLLSTARDEIPADVLSPRIARELFTDRIVSVSRLESFAGCPYSHFVTYGLRPEERREWQIDRSETGMFYHAAMEGFTRSLSADERWPHITRCECDQMMDAVLTPLIESWKDQVMDDTARARAEGKRYVNVCKRVAWAFTKGAMQSQFRPSGGEIAFGYPGGPPALTLTLDDGTRVYVRGRIDRVDRFETDESVYLRVIDYKSGTQALDPARIWMGMQLQLLLYLEAMLQYEKGALPAGAFYQWMGDPLVDQHKKGLIESEIAKKLCLKGVMLSDVQVIEWMDSSKPPVAIEDVLKKDGTVRKGKLACTLEEMHGLISLAHKTAIRLTEEMRKGSIEASPVCDKSNISQCKFCNFAGVCRRDARLNALSRALPDLHFEDLIEKMQKATQKP